MANRIPHRLLLLGRCGIFCGILPMRTHADRLTSWAYGSLAMPRKFQGTINLDVRNSKPDWNAFLDNKTPEGAPNVLVILYDDTGQAAWSTYGGRIEMPTL